MIPLRYHVVSITAVFLAVALGVVLGSTALSNTVLSGLSHQRDDLTEQAAQLRAQRSRLQSELRGSQRFVASIGPSAVQGALGKRTVALVTTPSTRRGDRAAVGKLLKDAGATVTAQLKLTRAFTDPNESARLRDIVTRVIPAGVQLPTSSDPGTLGGGLLGSILLLGPSDNQPQASGDEVARAISALSEGGFIEHRGTPRPAQLAIVLTAGAYHGDKAGSRASTLARFATQLAHSGAGTVLAGTNESASGTGAIGVVRADSAASSVLSTVDDIKTPKGRITTVLALRRELHGANGRYGTAGNAASVAPRMVAG